MLYKGEKMYKKIDFDEEVIKIREKGISTFTGYQTKKQIIVTNHNGEQNTYHFTNPKEYSDFNRKLRRIYQEQNNG